MKAACHALPWLLIAAATANAQWKPLRVWGIYPRLVFGVAKDSLYIIGNNEFAFAGRLQGSIDNILEDFNACHSHEDFDLYSIVNHNGYLLGQSSDTDLRRSSDGGRNWHKSNNGIPLLSDSCRPYSAPTAEDSIMVYGFNRRVETRCILSAHGRLIVGTTIGPYRSTDNGVTWKPLTRGFDKCDQESGDRSPQAVSGCPEVMTLARFGPWIIAGTTRGAYRIHKDSSAWERINGGLSADFMVHSIAATSTDLFAGIAYSNNRIAVYRSTDSGVTWQQSDRGLPRQSTMTLYAVYPSPQVVCVNDNILIVSIDPGQIYRSTDEGRSWEPYNEGLEKVYLYNLTPGLDILIGCGPASECYYRSLR